MKITFLIALIMIISLSQAYENMTYSNGQEVLDKLEDGSDDINLIMFYVSGLQGGTHNVRTTEDEKELISRVLNKHPSFKYAKVNADDEKYSDLIKAVGINTAELHESPSVLLMEGGTGVWIHGPQTVNRISEFADDYEKKVSGNKD